MIFSKKLVALLLLSYTNVATGQQCEPAAALLCRRTSTPPTLDGDLSDWSDVEGIESPLTAALGRNAYEHGGMGLKCLYDDENIYFAMEVPGRYRFNANDNHLCASMSYMTKIGADAAFAFMGACPLAMAGCPAAADVCESYKVDLGGHWELRTTEQGVRYGMNIDDGTGDDVVANKDDEYAYSPFCRPDDDGDNAGNEWAGAWTHSLSVAGDEVGTYVFEMSRLLQTASPETDTQFEAGNTYDFGAAFWDPYENESEGWSEIGHYVTGCSSDWMDLQLVVDAEVSDTDDMATDAGATDATAPQIDMPVTMECQLPGPLICRKTSMSPTLDGNLAEWGSVEGISAGIVAALGGMPYPDGAMELKCVYDDENIYFAMKVPGRFRFDPENNEKCASMSYMTKIGADAEFVMMGNCPAAAAGCPVSSSVCDSYRVDIGGHWELAGTQQRVLYGLNVTGGTGDDLIANKDDEYAFGPYCRLDDDGENAGNEWAGAWSHTSTLNEATASANETTNSYIFEMSRLLITASNETDAQYIAGETYHFGAAFFDPYQTEDGGWTDVGHYVTGCAADWIELRLDDGVVSDEIANYAAANVQITDDLATDDMATDAGETDGTATDAGTADAGETDDMATDTGAADAGEINDTATDTGATDTGATDAGATDAGATDAGATDAGATDAGATDAGATDAGATDAGATDAGATDAGATNAGATNAGATDAGATDETAPQIDMPVNMECQLPEPLICRKTSMSPTLDGRLAEWRTVEGISTGINAALGGMPYPDGAIELKCVYDNDNIYFAMKVPGRFRFDPEDNNKCASISYMTKIGADAEFVMMGNCPAAAAGCPLSPSVCDSYRVDIGGHWELASTQQRVRYGLNITGGTGDDLIANKDDEYAFGPYCRLDDDGENAGNEWAGAWSHTQGNVANPPVNGSYLFEMSRLLITASSETDAQYIAGETYHFGAAFFDPYQTEDAGWTDVGHYVTGCAADWIELRLDDGVVSDEIANYAAANVQIANNKPPRSAATMSMVATMTLSMSLLPFIMFFLI